MKNAFALMFGIAAMVAFSPLLAAPKVTVPSCKGRVVWTLPGKMYVLSNNPRYGKQPGSYACEAHLKALGYRMRPLQTGMHPVMHAPSSPIPNPSGNLNADKGATPNPMNNENGVRTTAAPPSSPRP